MSNFLGNSLPFYHRLAGLLPPQAAVLDLACGDGSFLKEALRAGAKKAVGVEISEEGILQCVHSGLTVYQGDITEGLQDHPDNSFDCVSLIRTVELLEEPEPVIEEMLRVGRTAILTFTNFIHWKQRLSYALLGRVPGTVPGRLGGPPTRLNFPIFKRFCHEKGIRIERVLPFPSALYVRMWPNLLVREFGVLLSKNGNH